MIDLKLLREDPDRVRASQRARGEDPALVDALLDADATRRAVISAADNLRAEQKAASKQVGAASAEERPALLARAKELAEQVKATEARQADAEAAFTAAHMAIVQRHHRRRPGGRRGRLRRARHGRRAARRSTNPKDHLELGESLGLIDMERGAKVSGSRFYFLTGFGALLQLGMLQLAVRLATENGFTLDDPAGAGAPGDHGGHRLPRRARRRGLPARGRRPVPRRHLGGSAGRLPLRRDPRPVRRAAALRRLVVVLPPRGRAATARTPAASSACTSSTRSRCSSTASPRTPRPSISGCWAGSARCSPRSRCPTA